MSEKVREIEDTLYFWFAANDTGGSAGDGASAAADVRLAGAAADAAPVLSPTPTLLSSASYPDGCYEVAVEATTANGFAAGNDYAVFCTLAIDSQNPAGIIGEFRLTAANDAPNTVAAIQSGLSKHSAADVWTSGTRTLTSFGTLVADAAAAVWGAAARTLTAFGFTTSANVTQVGGNAVTSAADFKADVSLLALEATLEDLPATTVAAIGAAHGSGRYDQTGTPVARIVSSRVLASEDRLTFYRDETPQEVLICVSPAVDLSSWDLWLTIKPPSAREDADNEAALCEVEAAGDAEGRITASVTAADIADMVLGRAYDFSVEGKSGSTYRLFVRGTCRLAHNVRRNVIS